VDFDAGRAAVVAGGPPDAVVGRWPGLVCVAQGPDPDALARLLDLCAAVAAEQSGSPGRVLARRLAMWLGAGDGSDGPGDDLRFGTLAVAGGQWATFLSGAVELVVPDQDLALSGAQSAAWTDRLLPTPDGPVALALDGVAVPPDMGGVHDLRLGVVPGSGVVLVPAGPAAGTDEPADAMPATSAGRPGTAPGLVPAWDEPAVPADHPPDAVPAFDAAPATRGGGAHEAPDRPAGVPVAGLFGAGPQHSGPQHSGAQPGSRESGGQESGSSDDGGAEHSGPEHSGTDYDGAEHGGPGFGGSGYGGSGYGGDEQGAGEHGADAYRDAGPGGRSGAPAADDPSPAPFDAVGPSPEKDRPVLAEHSAPAAPEAAGAGAQATGGEQPAESRPDPGFGGDRRVAAPPGAGAEAYQRVSDLERTEVTPRGRTPMVVGPPAGAHRGVPGAEDATAASPAARGAVPEAPPRPPPSGPGSGPGREPVPPQAPPGAATGVAGAVAPANPVAPRRAERIFGVAPAEPARPPLALGAPVGAPASVVQDEPTRAAVQEQPQAQGHLCARGHLNDPRSHFCVLCGIRMNERTGVLVIGSRPPLGLLVFDDGSTYTVDAEYLVGRMPEADQRVRSGVLRAIIIEDRSGSVSRVHAEVRVNGWDVMLVDSGSRNGTYLAGPGEPGWTPLPPHQSKRLVPGTRVRLGARTFVFESPSGVR